MMLLAPALNQIAAAQTPGAAGGPTADPRETARMHFGFLHLSPSVSLDHLGVDSNVFNSATDPKSDFTFSVTPRATMWVPFTRRALLTANASVGFVYYKTFDSQSSVNPVINAVGELYARRLTFSFEAGTSRTFRQPNAEITTRVKQYSDSLGAGVQFAMQRGLSVGVSTYRQTFRFGDDAVFVGVNLGDVLNRTEQGVRVRILERLTSLTTVGVVFETRQDRFERSSTSDADGYRVAASIDLAEKALISGSAEIGYRHVDPKSPVMPAFDGVVARVVAANRLSDSSRISLAWDRDMNYSFGVDQPHYLSNSLSASVRRQLVGRSDAIVGAARSRATYRQLLDAGPVDERREITTTYTVDLGYRLGRDSRLAFALSRINRTSTPADDREYTTTRAGLSLNYVF